jgi:glutathione peroxidase-family protein
MSAFHELTMASLEGDDISFAQFDGQACLVVNVASR